MDRFNHLCLELPSARSLIKSCLTGTLLSSLLNWNLGHSAPPVVQTQSPLNQTALTTQPSDPPFDQLRAWHSLEELVRRGNRYYEAPQRAESIKYLQTQLETRGAQVSLQVFKQREPISQHDYTLTNVIGRLNPDRPIRVLLGSHWDTRLWAEEDADEQRRQSPITGANDGSSGLAVLLEVAQQIKNLELKTIGVDIVFFDGEEFGRPGSNDYCAGSRYFAKHLSDYYPKNTPVGVIVIDMVGDQDLAFPPEQSSVAKARSLTTLIWREGVRLKAPAFLKGLGLDQPNAPQLAPAGKWIIDDHTPFQELNIPATLIIDLEYPQWHTHQDTLDRVSAESLKQTGQVLISSLKTLDHAISAQLK